MKQLYDKLNYALLLMEVKQHMFNLETRRDGWNLRTSNSYDNYMPNTTEYLNHNKLTKYLITFGCPSLCMWNTMNVTTSIFDFDITKIKQ